MGDIHDDGTTCPVEAEVIQLIEVTAVSNVTPARSGQTHAAKNRLMSIDPSSDAQ
jgi:hypothetical protein